MKVWTVWEGCYSSRELLGVFSTKEKAEDYRYRRLILGSSECDEINDEPIEYEIDVGTENVETFEVVFGKKVFFQSASGREREHVRINDSGTAFVVVNYHPDVTVMIKAARDKLAAFKAQKEGL